MAGAPVGNTNPHDGKLWKAAIKRALEKRAGKTRRDMVEALDELAEKFLEECDNKQGWAFRELGDRLDGKAGQEISGPGGGPIEHRVEEIRRTIVDPK